MPGVGIIDGGVYRELIDQDLDHLKINDMYRYYHLKGAGGKNIALKRFS